MFVLLFECDARIIFNVYQIGRIHVCVRFLFVYTYFDFYYNLRSWFELHEKFNWRLKIIFIKKLLFVLKCDKILNLVELINYQNNDLF